MRLQELAAAFSGVEREIANGPIVPTVTPAEIREHLSTHYDFANPAPLDRVIADVEQMMRNWNVQVTHPRYFGLFNPSVTAASVVADALVAMYNPQLAAWRHAPAANEIERHTLDWLTAKFGLPGSTAATFTTGGAESNLSAVIVALTRAFPDYGDRGLHRVSAMPTMYLTREAHASFTKIAHLTGIGRESLRIVATGDDLKMDVDDLARLVTDDRRSGCHPLMVIATAGTTAAGVIDPLGELAGVCRSERLWLHVDAAWGGAAILSPRLRRHLAGIEAADSITCDAHKWFSVPMGAGMFFCRHPDAVANAFRAHTSYMPPDSPEATVDPYTTSVQWSRRFIGLKLFMSLVHHGESGYVEMIERQARLGELLRTSLVDAGWRILNTTPLPVVCFTRDGLSTGDFLSDLHDRQIAWMSDVHLRNDVHAVRACVTSFRTAESDIEDVVRQMTTLALGGGTDRSRREL
jgi:aromatic-L-amino-acid decarboxylase